MSKFEIVMALLSFVYALALTHLLQGISDLIQNRNRVRWSAVHGAWLALALITLINNWLALIPLRNAEWGRQLILLAFTGSAIQYFTCSLIMPPISSRGTIDLEKFQIRNGWIFISPYLIMLLPVIGQNFMFRGQYGLGDLTLLEFLPRMWPLYLAIAFFALAMWRRERWLRLTIPAVFGALALTRLIFS